jgi:hypothetical protein
LKVDTKTGNTGQGAHRRKAPFTPEVIPHGVQIGLRKRW